MNQIWTSLLLIRFKRIVIVSGLNREALDSSVTSTVQVNDKQVATYHFQELLTTKVCPLTFVANVLPFH